MRQTGIHPEWLAERLAQALADPKDLTRRAQAAKSAGNSDAPNVWPIWRSRPPGLTAAPPASDETHDRSRLCHTLAAYNKGAERQPLRRRSG